MGYGVRSHLSVMSRRRRGVCYHSRIECARGDDGSCDDTGERCAIIIPTMSSVVLPLHLFVELLRIRDHFIEIVIRDEIRAIEYGLGLIRVLL